MSRAAVSLVLSTVTGGCVLLTMYTLFEGGNRFDLAKQELTNLRQQSNFDFCEYRVFKEFTKIEHCARYHIDVRDFTVLQSPQANNQTVANNFVSLVKYFTVLNWLPIDKTHKMLEIIDEDDPRRQTVCRIRFYNFNHVDKMILDELINGTILLPGIKYRVKMELAEDIHCNMCGPDK